MLAQALSKDPRQRPRDAYAFAERLYDLEWASDGAKPRGETVRGHAPIAAVLTTIDLAKKGDAGSEPRIASAPRIPVDNYGPTTARVASVRSMHDTFALQHADARPAQRSKTLGLVLPRSGAALRRARDCGRARAPRPGKAGPDVHAARAGRDAGDRDTAAAVQRPVGDDFYNR